jgi:5,10-methylenetetrahydromethanopterin reductase
VDGLELDRTVPVPVPLHLAALQDGMVGLAGRVADGVILNLCPVEAVGGRLRRLREVAGHRSAGLPDPEVACVVPCCVSDDAELALAAARDVVLDYMLHPAAVVLYGEVGDPALVAAVQARLAAGHREEAAGLVPDGLVDAFVAYGPPAACAERVARYRAAGVGTPIVFPRPVGRRWAEAVWELAAACAAPGGRGRGSGGGGGNNGDRPGRSGGDRTTTIDRYQPSTIGGST